MRFVDTGVLLYAVSTAPAEAAKRRAAREILGSDDLALSVQVLEEFYVQATRPSRTGQLTHADACALVDSWRRFPVQETTTALLDTALDTCRRFRLPYRDAAVIEAARLLGCDTLLSEGLRHGRVYRGVRVENPFRRPLDPRVAGGARRASASADRARAATADGRRPRDPRLRP